MDVEYTLNKPLWKRISIRDLPKTANPTLAGIMMKKILLSEKEIVLLKFEKSPSTTWWLMSGKTAVVKAVLKMARGY